MSTTVAQPPPHDAAAAPHRCDARDPWDFRGAAIHPDAELVRDRVLLRADARGVIREEVEALFRCPNCGHLQSLLLPAPQTRGEADRLLGTLEALRSAAADRDH